MTKVELRINGVRYEQFENFSFSRSLDDVCASFSFESINKPDYPYKIGNKIEILINNKLVFTGYIFNENTSGDVAGSTKSVSGRDLTGDLVDSSLPASAKNLEGAISLKKMAETVLSGLGLDIKVIDRSGGIEDFTEDDLQAGASGSMAFEYLRTFARKRQVYFITDETGNLVIFKPSGVKAYSPLILRKGDSDRSNIKYFNKTKSHNQRFGRYICRSQDDEEVDRNGDAIDNDIRSSRYLEIIAEESMDDDVCVKRAKEEANIRRIRGEAYSAIVAGVEQADGSFWAVGAEVKVYDEVSGVKGVFLIRKIDIKQTPESGTLTTITVALPDAYQSKDIVTPTIARKSDMG